MPTRPAAPLAALVVAAALVAGCGGSSPDDGFTSTGATSRTESAPAADAPAGASAKSCEAQAVDVAALRATGIPCDRARQVMLGWQRQGSCAIPSSASRGGCLTRSYHCQAVRTDRGAAVSCARPGQSIAFLAERG